MATPSVQAIQKTFPKLSKAQAADIRGVMQRAARDASVERALEIASQVIGGYGVDIIRGPHFRRGYWADALLVFVNVGDAYEATIGFEPSSFGPGRFLVLPGGYGSWVEWYERKTGETLS